MAKLVNENIIRETVVCGDRAVEVEDSAAAVGAIVCEYLDELVRRKLRDFPQRAIVKREHVTFGAERVVGRAHRRVAINAGRRSGDSTLERRRTKRPDVEVLSVFFERRSREQNFGQTASVTLKLPQLACRVAVAKYQKVYLRRWIAHALNGNQSGRRLGL